MPVFANISFNLAANEGLFLRGANGSGKTSLLMVLAGFLPYSGVLQITTPDDEIPASQMMHFIGHQNAIKKELSLRQNLQFWSDMYGGDKSSIIDALDEAGLYGLENFAAGHLSTGQKHRLSLCRLLVSPRPLWLLDEPTSALDQQGDKWVADLIARHLQDGGMVIAATHRQIDLQQIDLKQQKNRIKMKSLLLGKI